MESTGCRTGYLFRARACQVCGAIRQSITDVTDTQVCAGCLRRIDADPREKRAFLLSAIQPLEW